MMNRYRDAQDKTQSADELFKWEQVKQFQDAFQDYEKGNLSFESLLLDSKWDQLVYHNFTGMMKLFLESNPEAYQEAIEGIWDESTELEQRISRFSEQMNALLQPLKNETRREHFHDEREIATLLTYRYPERYTFYMSTFYARLSRCMGEKPKTKNKAFIHYMTLVERIRKEVLPKFDDVVAPNTHFIEDIKYYDDPEHLILIQDILYVTLYKGGRPETEVDDEPETSKLNEALNLFAYSEVVDYLKLMDRIVSHGSLRSGDERLLFTLAENRLNFSIGQRYVAILYPPKQRKKEALCNVIGLTEFGRRSDEFDNKSPKATFNRLDEISLNKEEFDSHLGAVDQELNRTKKSGLRRHNDEEFELFVFDKAFRNEVLSQLFPEHQKPKGMSDLNIILYGPPGTGKTYTLKSEYFEKYTVRESSVTLDQYFKEQVTELSWWQAIGLALLELNGRGKVAEILENRWVREKAAISVSKNVRATIWGNLQTHTIENSSTVGYKMRIPPLIFDKNDDSSWVLLKEAWQEQCNDLTEIKESVDSFKASSDKSIERFVFTTFHQSYSYEDFMEGIKPVMEEVQTELSYSIEPGIFKKLCERAANDPENRYAIFIDEINRGNIANIFGELITLIEPDKRKGEDNEMAVTLPYSKKKFSVPANVDIYGTMNTADRSVEALDTALRRRFSFVEMPPKPELEELQDKIDEMKFSAGDVLRKLNDRLLYFLDHDHLIGHSFFIDKTSLEDINQVFQKNIIPQLKEYFYGNHSRIAAILGWSTDKGQAFLTRTEVNSNEMQFPDEIEDSGEKVNWVFNSFIDDNGYFQKETFSIALNRFYEGK
ncbi:MAG: AAA family ATPase [Cryomorphaceae bacterium]